MPILRILLAWALVPIPVLGWIAAQSFTKRIAHNYDFTAELLHTYTASSFAIVFVLSAVTNAIIVSVRARYRPRSHRASRYVVWQSALIALAVGWLFSLRVGEGWTQIVENILGTLIAAVSIVVCVFAAKGDAAARQSRRDRWEARSPEARLRITRTRLLVPVVAVVLAVAAVVVVQNSETLHPGCVVNGNADFDGSRSIYTTNCGDFAIESDNSAPMGSTLDITTRGFRFGLPPQPLVVSVVES